MGQLREGLHECIECGAIVRDEARAGHAQFHEDLSHIMGLVLTASAPPRTVCPTCYARVDPSESSMHLMWHNTTSALLDLKQNISPQ